MATRWIWPSTIHVLFFLAFITVSRAISCEFSVEMTQGLLGKGFHRNLTYSIEVLEQWPVPLDGSCVLSVEQPIPAGLYANPDELFEMNQAGKLVAEIRERIDIELPAEAASPATVFIMQLLDGPHLSLWIPLHARYHKAVSGGGYATARVPPAKLFVSCQPKQLLADCMRTAEDRSGHMRTAEDRSGHMRTAEDRSGHCPRNALCRWIPIRSTLMSEELVWLIPVGNLNHGHLVSFLTAVAYVGCSIFILKTLHGYKRTKPHQK